MAQELGKKSVTQLDYCLLALGFYSPRFGLQLASFFGGVSGWLMSNTNHNFQLGDDFQLIT